MIIVSTRFFMRIIIILNRGWCLTGRYRQIFSVKVGWLVGLLALSLRWVFRLMVLASRRAISSG